MKSIQTLVTLLFFTLILSSCSKDDNNGSGLGEGTLTAKVDGVSFNSTLGVQAFNSNGALSLTGAKAGEQISIVIPSYNGPATFNIASGSVFATYSTTSPIGTWSASMVSGSGSIIISDHSGGRIKGTFSFTATSGGSSVTTKNITEGQFDITL